MNVCKIICTYVCLHYVRIHRSDITVYVCIYTICANKCAIWMFRMQILCMNVCMYDLFIGLVQSICKLSQLILRRIIKTTQMILHHEMHSQSNAKNNAIPLSFPASLHRPEPPLDTTPRSPRRCCCSI